MSSTQPKRPRMEPSEEQETSQSQKGNRDTIAMLVSVTQNLSDQLKDEKQENRNVIQSNEKLRRRNDELKRKLRKQQKDCDARVFHMRENYIAAREALEHASHVTDIKRESLVKEVRRRQQLEEENQEMSKKIKNLEALVEEKEKEAKKRNEEIVSLRTAEEQLKIAIKNTEDAAWRHECACSLSNGQLVDCRFRMRD